jgi:hypothetical protein
MSYRSGGLEYSILQPTDIVNMTEVRLETHQFYVDGLVAQQGPLD